MSEKRKYMSDKRGTMNDGRDYHRAGCFIPDYD
jgi:hypothetical protein